MDFGPTKNTQCYLFFFSPFLEVKLLFGVGGCFFLLLKLIS